MVTVWGCLLLLVVDHPPLIVPWSSARLQDEVGSCWQCEGLSACGPAVFRCGWKPTVSPPETSSSVEYCSRWVKGAVAVQTEELELFPC